MGAEQEVVEQGGAWAFTALWAEPLAALSEGVGPNLRRHGWGRAQELPAV